MSYPGAPPPYTPAPSYPPQANPYYSPQSYTAPGYSPQNLHYSQGGYPAPKPVAYTPPPPPASLPAPPPSLKGWCAQYYWSIPPSEFNNMKIWFSAVDRDHSGTIEADELAQLQIVPGRPLGLDSAKLLVKIFDKNYNGTLDFYEYVCCHQFLSHMMRSFWAADHDRSGFLDMQEIHSALMSAGFQLSVGTVQEICKKYGIGSHQGVNIEEWIKLCAHLASIRSVFEWNDPNRTGRVSFSYDQLAHVSMFLMDKKK